jgi:hypothetical protein
MGEISLAFMEERNHFISWTEKLLQVTSKLFKDNPFVSEMISLIKWLEEYRQTPTTNTWLSKIVTGPVPLHSALSEACNNITK